MVERVGIEIEVLNYSEAEKQLSRLDKELTGLMGKRPRIEVEARLDEVRRNLKSLESHKVVLKADLNDVNKQINEIRKEIKNLQAVKLRLEASGEKTDGIMSRIRELRADLAELEANKIDIQTNLAQVKTEMEESTTEANRLSYALKNFKTINLKSVFDGISTRMAHAGGAMQSFGNALSRVSNITRGLTAGVTMGLGYGALNKVTEGLKSGFTRYDTMKKYTRIMEALGYSADDTKGSIERLNDAVNGLPTSLDSITEMSQRFALATGDIDKATDVAIASNNAFLASMSTDSQRYQGMLQLSDLLNGKKLTSREWYSLGTSMGAAINEVGKELGYGEEKLGEFRQALYGGSISTQDFLDALVKVGTGEGKIRKMALESMDTWEAFFSRIGTAASRFTYGVLTAMDDIINTVTGGKFTSLNSFLDDKIIPSINSMTEAAKKWIKAHPQEIIDFFKQFKSIDIASLGKGFVSGMRSAVELYAQIAKLFSGRRIGGIGKFLALSGPVGRLITIAGGLIKGSRHIVAGGTVGLMWLVRSIGYLGDGKFIRALTKLAKGKSAVNGAEKAVEGVGGLAGTVGRASLSWQGVATGAIAVAAIPAIAGAVKLIASAFKDLEGLKMENMQSKIFYMVESVGMLGALAGAIGALITSLGAGGFVFAAGTAVGIGLIDVLAYTIKQTADAVNAIANMKVPDKATVRQAISTMKDLAPDLGKLATALSGSAPSYNSNVANSYAEVIKGVTQLGKALEEMADADLDSGKITTANDKLQALKKPMQDLMETLSDMFGQEFFASNSGTQYGGGYVKTGSKLNQSAINNASSASSALLLIVQNVKNLIQPLLDLSKELDLIPENFDEDFQAKLQPISNIIKNLMSYDGSLGSLAQDAQLYQTVQTNVTSLKTALSSIKTIIKSMRDLTAEDLGDINLDSLMTKLKDTISALNTNLGDTGALMIKALSLKASITAVVDALNALSGINGGTVDFSGVISGIDSIGSSADSSKAKVDALSSALDALGKKKPKVTITVNNTLALARIASVKTALNNLPTYKSISIGVNRTGSIGAVAGNTYPHSGGKIGYYNNGGKVFYMTPKGTDTVPAMLTPGEFVQRRKAVKAFGTDFMNKVNNLDFRGVAQSLRATVGRRMDVIGTTNITNNYNNNAKVTQIINNPTQDFAFRRASRFVGAL